MLDSVQLVLLFVIVSLTILLIVLGIQVFFILSEFRKTVFRANKILERAENITQSIQEPLAAVSSFAFGFKTSSLLSVAKFIKNLLNREPEEEKKHHRD